MNHPNVAAIYGFEESNGTQALVLELVEGPTLADRIAQGAMPFDEALPIARQIAEALEVTPDGTRFIAVVAGQIQSGQSTTPQIQVVLNWFEELKQLVPTK